MSEQTLSLSMYMLFDCSVKAFLLAGVAAVVTGILRPLTVHIQHRIWTISLFAILLLPLAAYSGFGWQVPIVWWPTAGVTAPGSRDSNVKAHELANSGRFLDDRSSTATVTTKSALAVATSGTTSALKVIDSCDSLAEFDPIGPAGTVRNQRLSRWFSAILLTWLVGVMVLAVRLVMAVCVTRRILKHAIVSESLSAAAGVRVCESHEIKTPAVVHWCTPCILVPVHWSARPLKVRNAAFAHELAHIRRRDGLISLLAEVTTILYWFHPMAWLTRRRLSQLAELACDESAAIAINDRVGYARYLMEIAAMNGRRPGWQPGIAMAQRSEIKYRVQALLNPARPLSDKVTRLAMACILTIGAPSAMLIAAVHPSGFQQETDTEITQAHALNTSGTGGSLPASEKPVETTSQKSETSPASRVNLVSTEGQTASPSQSRNSGDQFLRGELPAITVAGWPANQVKRVDPGASLGVAGKVDLTLQCKVCVELRLLSDELGKRLTRVSIATSQRTAERQFGVTLSPPEDGWPMGLIRMRVCVDEFPMIYQDSYLWTGNLQQQDIKVPQAVDESTGFARMDLSPGMVVHAFEIDAGVPIAYCGRFSDADEAVRVQEDSLTLTITVSHPKHGTVTVGSGISLMLREPESCWFEMLDAMPRNGLPAGTYTVSLNSARGRLVAERSLIVLPPEMPNQ